MQPALVTRREDLRESFRAALPEATDVDWHRTERDLLDHALRDPQAALPSVIFLDRTQGPGQPTGLGKLRQQFPGTDPLLVALLDNPSELDGALAARVDECLLLPLVSSELGGLLRARQYRQQDRLELLGVLVQGVTEGSGSAWSAWAGWLENLNVFTGADAAWEL